MKYAEAPSLPVELLSMSHEVGGKLARLRKARRLRQADVALRQAEETKRVRNLSGKELGKLDF